MPKQGVSKSSECTVLERRTGIRGSSSAAGRISLARLANPIPYHCLVSEQLSGMSCPIPMLKNATSTTPQPVDIFSITNYNNGLWKKHPRILSSRHSPCYYPLHQTQRRVETQMGTSLNRETGSQREIRTASPRVVRLGV